MAVGSAHGVTVSRLVIAASSSGANVLLAAQTGKKIKVVNLALMASAAVNVKFQSHTTPTDITGLFYLAANGGFVLQYSDIGWFATLSGEGLDINLSAGNAVGGVLHYILVT